jgi:hypothetical protein
MHFILNPTRYPKAVGISAPCNNASLTMPFVVGYSGQCIGVTTRLIAGNLLSAPATEYGATKKAGLFRAPQLRYYIKTSRMLHIPTYAKVACSNTNNNHRVQSPQYNHELLKKPTYYYTQNYTLPVVFMSVKLGLSHYWKNILVRLNKYY